MGKGLIKKKLPLPTASGKGVVICRNTNPMGKKVASGIVF